jgi:hypothetical protein
VIRARDRRKQSGERHDSGEAEEQTLRHENDPLESSELTAFGV